MVRIALRIEALGVVLIEQRRTEPTAARIVIQIAVRDADQIEWQTEVQGATPIVLREIERTVDQIAVLVQTDSLVVVVQADRDSILVDMVDLIADQTSAVILLVASSVEDNSVVVMDTGVAGQILACSLSERWDHVLIEADTAQNLDVACQARGALVDKAHSSAQALKDVVQVLIDQHRLVVATATMIVSQHASEMVGIVGHRLFCSYLSKIGWITITQAFRPGLDTNAPLELRKSTLLLHCSFNCTSLNSQLPTLNSLTAAEEQLLQLE